MSPPTSKPAAAARRRGVRQALLALAAGVTFGQTVTCAVLIPSGSMQPTLDPGDWVALDRLAYGLTLPWVGRPLVRWSQPLRGDVVVFNAPAWADPAQRLVIKRVVALAGDTVEVRGHRVILNGTPVPVSARGAAPVEHLGRWHRLIEGPGRLADMPPLTVPPGHVFVMGDHRSDSADSRYWGPLPVERIRGRARAVVASMDWSRWKGGQAL